MALLDPRPGEWILDVGCGRGAALRYLAGQVGSRGRAVGVEPAAYALADLRAALEAEKALAGDAGAGETPALPVQGPSTADGTTAVASKRMAVEGDGEGRGIDDTRSGAVDAAAVEPVAADAQALPFPDETFDAVLCVNVLEAVPDRLGALREMRRVLKPGGRVLVAHDDYEGQVYTATDRPLCRRAVLAYARSTFESYATSDGQIGRHLWGYFAKAGFRNATLQVLPLVNTEYREPLFGWTHAQFSATFVEKVSDLTDDDLDRWRADLAGLSARGEYLYCINLFVCLGRK